MQSSEISIQIWNSRLQPEDVVLTEFLYPQCKSTLLGGMGSSDVKVERTVERTKLIKSIWSQMFVLVILGCFLNLNVHAQTVTKYPYPGYGILTDMNGENQQGNSIGGVKYRVSADCDQAAAQEAAARKLANPSLQELKLGCTSNKIWYFNWSTQPQPPVEPKPPTKVGYGQLPSNPRVHTGSNERHISPTSEVAPPSSDSTGNFRTVCAASHFGFDDPLVYPNQPGVSHMHVFFGNTGVNAYTNHDNLLNSGGSTCRGGIINRSSYWAPALIDMSTNRPAIPEDSNFYYKSGYQGIRPDQINVLPAGLRMIAGNAMATTDERNPAAPFLPFTWSCHNSGGTHTGTILDCPVGDQLEMTVTFPQCWNGYDLDSSDHKSHMSYPINNACPSTHPFGIPEISFHILYAVSYSGQYSNHRLSSDTYQGPAGYSAHGDYFNGWESEVSDAWGRNCVRVGRDCHSHLIGDGRAIFDDAAAVVLMDDIWNDNSTTSPQLPDHGIANDNTSMSSTAIGMSSELHSSAYSLAPSALLGITTIVIGAFGNMVFGLSSQ